MHAIDFTPLAGKAVFLDSSSLDDREDHEYIVASLLDRMRSQCCVVKDSRSQATYNVEARAWAIGTDRHETLIGIPASKFTMPVGSHAGQSVRLPEAALAKRTNQSGAAKIACFAYHRETGQAFWQSGTTPVWVSTKETLLGGKRVFKRRSVLGR